MGRETAIQWCDATHNFWSGCAKVTAGCDHCYAERLMQRFGRDFGTVTRAPAKRFGEPLAWEKRLVAQAAGMQIMPLKVFTCSMSDFFHPAADAWRDDAWAIIRQTPHLTYQILTKRPNRIARSLPADWGERGYPNVWLGVTVEANGTLWRTDFLRAVPAAVRFVSYEPGTAPLLTGNGDALRLLTGIDWLIVGGESGGHEARPFDLRWARDAVAAARTVGAAPFVKQLGSVWAREHKARDWHGGDWSEWPAPLRVREFPQAVLA